MAERRLNRRRLIVLAAASAVSLSAHPLLAQTAADPVIGRLRREGFTTFRVRRTFLGRIRIEASHPNGSAREIVLNPNTGEVLRDYWDDRDDDDDDRRNDREDDRDDDRRDRDREDEKEDDRDDDDEDRDDDRDDDDDDDDDGDDDDDDDDDGDDDDDDDDGDDD